jgi:hypothetical protein
MPFTTADVTALVARGEELTQASRAIARYYSTTLCPVHRGMSLEAVVPAPAVSSTHRTEVRRLYSEVAKEGDTPK